MDDAPAGSNRPIAPAKLTRPSTRGALRRDRLFHSIERGREKKVIWITGPAGSGKTTLAASYLDSHKAPCLWYQMDAGDADLATFFYYLGLAAKNAAPRNPKPLPLLTPEYLLGIPVFAGFSSGAGPCCKPGSARNNPPRPEPSSRGSAPGGKIEIMRFLKRTTERCFY